MPSFLLPPVLVLVLATALLLLLCTVHHRLSNLALGAYALLVIGALLAVILWTVQNWPG